MYNLLPNRLRKLSTPLAIALLIAVLATGVPVVADDGLPGRPEAAVIRQQVEEILSQPEYQSANPVWLHRALTSVWEALRRLLRALDPGRVIGHIWDYSPLLGWLIILALASVLLALLYHIFTTIRNAFGRPHARRTRHAEPTPVPLTSPAELRRQAREHAHQGDFAGALVLLYQACLRYLERQGHLRYHPATTNGEYLLEVAGELELSRLLRPLTHAVDPVAYGLHPLGASRYEYLDALAQQLWQEADG